MYSKTFLVAVLTTIPSLSSAHDGHDNNTTQYTLTDDMSYTNFFSAFDFYSDADPSKGFVQYQDQASATSKNLVGYLEDTQSVFMGVDYTTKDPLGRASVRLESKKSWNRGLLIADIRHMPHSQCGVWCAFWLLSSTSSWPEGGEIDILEGANDYEHNAVTLHNSADCMVDNATTPASGSESTDNLAPFSGHMATDDCDVAAPGQGKNVGCSIRAPDSLSGTTTGGMENAQSIPVPSYGTDFNAAGGGIYATEWTISHISVWFFLRDSPGFTEHFNSIEHPDPSAWGTPLARFSGSGCDYSQRFKDLRIVFNTPFCGEWAGKEKTGVDTCEEFVREHPEAFTEAYWEVGGLKWFQKGGEEEVKREPVKARGWFFGW